MARRGGSGGDFGGANPPAGAQIRYHLAEDAEGELSIEIRDATGQLVRRYSSEQTPHQDCLVANMDLRSPFTLSFPGKVEGINRWSWDLGEDDFPCIEGIAQWVGYSGARVAPGRYEVTVTADGHSQDASFELLADPRITASAQQTAGWRAAVGDLGDLYREVISGLKEARKASTQVSRLMADYPDDETLEQTGQSAIDRLAVWDRLIDQELHETYEDEDAWPVLLLGQVMNLHSVVESSGAPVSSGALERTADLRAQWAERRQELDAIVTSDITAINQWARDHQVPHVVKPLGSP